MRKRLKFKLDCDEDLAAEYLETATHPYIEKGYSRESGEVRLYLMREHKGMRYVEYVFDGRLANGAIAGEMKTPQGDGDRPGLLKSLLLAFMALCVLAALFGAIYLFVNVFARNFWLALYIAMPVFAGLIAFVALLAFLNRRRKKQLGNLTDYLGRVASLEKKKRKK